MKNLLNAKYFNYLFILDFERRLGKTKNTSLKNQSIHESASPFKI